MPDTTGGAMDVRRLLAERWTAHKDLLWDAASFDPGGGGTGFVCMDRHSVPPVAWLARQDPLNGFVALRADLPESETARSDPAGTALDMLAGHLPSVEIPIGEADVLFGLRGGTPELAGLSVTRFCESLKNDRIVALLARTRDGMVAAEERRFDEAGLPDLRATLNRDVLEVLANVEGAGWDEYAYFAEPGDVGEVRRQAAKIYPMLSSFIMGRGSLRRAVDCREPLGPLLVAAFGEDRESGKPRLSKAILSRLQNKPWPGNGLSPEKLAFALARIDPNWFPANREDWDAFCDLATTVDATLSDTTGIGVDVLYKGCGGKWKAFRDRVAAATVETRAPEGMEESDAQRLLAAMDAVGFKTMTADQVRGNALEFAAQNPLDGIQAAAVADWAVRLHAPDLTREAIQRVCLAAIDMANLFAQKVLLPIAANQSGLQEIYLSEPTHARARLAAARILFGDKSANSVIEAARHMHTQIEVITAAGTPPEELERRRKLQEEMSKNGTLNAVGIPSADIPEDGWPPLMPLLRAPNGLFLVALTDPRLLEDEGRHGINADGTSGLYHCVGGYSESCRRNGHHIVSIREVLPGGSYVRKSTVEVNPLVHGDFNLTHRQHYGVHNRGVPAEAERALAWFYQSVKDGSVQLNWERIKQHQGGFRNREGDELEPYCGYDWKDVRSLGAAMAPWGKYVGKRYRSMGLSQFAESDEVYRLADWLNPGLRPVGGVPSPGR